MDGIEHGEQSGESTFEIIGESSPIALDVHGTRIAPKWPRAGVFAPIAGLLAVLALGLASYVLASNHQPNVKIQAIPRVLSLTDSQCKLVPADTFSTTIASSPTPSYNAPASNYKSHYVYVRFSQKGKLVYSTSTTGEQDDTTIWDTNGNKLFTLKGFVVGVTANNEVLALSDNGEPELFDVTGKIIGDVKAKVYGINFSDVTRQFLTLDTNRMVQLWDINGKLIETLNDRVF